MSNYDVQEYVTVTIANQMFGIPVLQVHDVLGSINLTTIPLAPPEVAGALNLRGRIVTCIDVRKRLGLPARKESGQRMSVVVEHQGEPYALLIDTVGEVLNLKSEQLERNPGNSRPLVGVKFPPEFTEHRTTFLLSYRSNVCLILQATQAQPHNNI